MNNITIYLADSKNAKKFSEGNLIHVKEFKQVIGWINDRVRSIEAAEAANHGHPMQQVPEQVRLHETITVMGTRGSGKTSFLLSVLDACRQQNLEVVNIIDPTLIEEKGHIFLTILSEINTRVTAALAKMECSPEKQAHFYKAEWDRKVKKLARGLPAMDIINNGYQDWQDPEYVMNTGLQNVYAARTLETNFHELLKFGLQILNKKAFVIALDDIDIDFRRGWPILETIRKYMTTPYIITLLSGDTELFSIAIRKQQWKNFGKALLKNECEMLEQMKKYHSIVTEMANQYMLKVLQPGRRVYLTTLKEKVAMMGNDVTIFINSIAPDNRIDLFYNVILSRFGIVNPYQAEPYRSTLFGMPIRKQIHFLSIFDDPNKKQENVVNEIAEVFLSDLYEKNIDIEQIKIADNRLTANVLKLLVDEKVLEDSYQLQPITTDHNLNIVLMVLSFFFSLKTQNNPYLIFDYLIKVGYIRNVLSTIGYQNDNKNIHAPSLEHLCQFTNIYNDTGLRDIACSISAYLHISIKNGKDGEDFLGIINLPGLESNQKQSKQDIAWRIDDVFKDVSKALKDIAFLPLSISQDNKSNQGRLSYSIYTLLASIGEIIRKFKLNDQEWSTLAQLRSYPMPAFESGNSFGRIDIETTEYEIIEAEDDVLILIFKRWIDGFPENHSVSPHLLGKISSRFFYVLRRIEGMSEQANLAESMHTRIVIFMNAVLIEEIKEFASAIIPQLNINNPNLSDAIFIANLQKINRMQTLQSRLQLSRWICSCPLLLSFLKLKDGNENSPLFTALQEFVQDKHGADLMGKEYSVYDRLAQVKYSDPNPKNENGVRQTIKPRFNSRKPWERERVIQALQEAKVPRKLFDLQTSQTITANVNEQIRILTQGLFAEEKLENYNIREFRQYLAQHKIIW